jgi:CheY-like chemotaxis protein
VSDGEQHTPGTRRGTIVPLPSLKVLIIDDNLSFAQALAKLLHRNGAIVDTANTGQRAVGYLRVHSYDVLLCDLRMPALTGPELYTLLREQYPHLLPRVIFLTGDTLGAESMAFLAQCGQSWLQKPFTAAALRRALQQVCRAQ